MFKRQWCGVLVAMVLAASAHAQTEAPLVKRFNAGDITMLQTRDGRLWSPLVDRTPDPPQISTTRYFGAVTARSAGNSEILTVATLYLPPQAVAGARSFEETYEVQCEAKKVQRTVSAAFSGEYLSGSRVNTGGPALKDSEKTSLLNQACAARDFELEYRGSDPFK